MKALDQDEVAQLVLDALAYAIDRDANRAADVLSTLGTGCDTKTMYGVCCAIAEAGKQMLEQIYGDWVPQPGSDDMWVLEQIEPGALDDPVRAFSARFLTAYCNGDRGTRIALYQAALGAGPDQYAASICALLSDVARISRLALARKDGAA